MLILDEWPSLEKLSTKSGLSLALLTIQASFEKGGGVARRAMTEDLSLILS